MTIDNNSEAWIARQAQAGWPSYSRAVFALARLDHPWPRSDAPPENPEGYMQSWWKASRRWGLAPEDVQNELV